MTATTINPVVCGGPGAKNNYTQNFKHDPEERALTLEQRLAEAFKNTTNQKKRDLIESSKASLLKHRGIDGKISPIKNWEELKKCLPKACENTNVLDFGTTYFMKSGQRPVHLPHLIDIIQSINTDWLVPMKTIKYPNSKDDLLVWDGQHTILALYFIAKEVFNVSSEELKCTTMPNSFHPISVAAAHEAFNAINGDKILPVSKFEKLKQWYLVVDEIIRNNMECHYIRDTQYVKNKKYYDNYNMLLENGLYIVPDEDTLNTMKNDLQKTPGDPKWEGAIGRIVEFLQENNEDVLRAMIDWYKVGKKRGLSHWSWIVPYKHMQKCKIKSGVDARKLAEYTKEFDHNFDGTKFGEIRKNALVSRHERNYRGRTSPPPVDFGHHESTYLAVFNAWLNWKGAPANLCKETSRYNSTQVFFNEDFV